MLRTIFPRTSKDLLKLIIVGIPVMAIIGWLVAIYGGPLFTRLIEKSLTSAGGTFNLVIIAISLLLVPLFIVLLLRGSMVAVMSLYIICLPAIYRFRGFWAIEVRPNNYQSPELVSVTTFLIFVLLIIFIARGYKLRKSGNFYRTIECLLWGYVILGTTSQFVNLDISSAFWLSLKGLWQYLALFYLMSGAINDRNDINLILKAVVISIAIGIVFRQGTHGVGFAFEDLNSGGLLRIDGGAFGPAVSYGGYLAFVSVISLYLARSAHKRFQRLLWLLFTALIVFELVNTHTRGAMLSLILIPLLIIFPRERKFILPTILIGTLIFILLSATTEISNLISQRNFSLSVSLLNDPNAQIRFELWKLSLPHVFDRFGLGYGIGNALNMITSRSERALPSHNLVFELTQYVGAFSTLCFLALYVVTLVRAGRYANRSSQLAYSFIALSVWFVFANTTSTSILYYYPCEATILMFTILFLTQLDISLNYSNGRVLKQGSILPAD